MDELEQKRTRVGREEWAKRVGRWRDSGLTTAEFATELGISPKTLTNWAWKLEREATGKRRARASKKRAATASAAPTATAFIQVTSPERGGRFELEVRGRLLHIPSSFDAQQLRALLEILETA